MWKLLNKILALTLIFSLILEQSGFAQVPLQLQLPAYINGYVAADRFRPVQLSSLSFDPGKQNFNLFLDKGDQIKIDPGQITRDAKLLMQYFRIGLALPNDSFWVNLRPDAADQIIDSFLEKTDVGQVMLAADLQLKKDLAGFTSPKTEEGRLYWDKLYARAEKLFGGQEISIPTLTRPWIVPGEVIVRETSSGCHILKASLKVCLEQDYIKDSESYNFNDPRLKELNDFSSQLIRENILPKLTREVNSSKKYATLRQVYYSLILAQWFKEKYRGQAGEYAKKIDGFDLNGLTSARNWKKEKYFNAYNKSFKKGEYNISENRYAVQGASIRQYFSGGMQLFNAMPGNGNPAGLRIQAEGATLDPANELVRLKYDGGQEENGPGEIKPVIPVTNPLHRAMRIAAGGVIGVSIVTGLLGIAPFWLSAAVVLGSLNLLIGEMVRFQPRTNSDYDTFADAAGAAFNLGLSGIGAVVLSSLGISGLTIIIPAAFAAGLTGFLVGHHIPWERIQQPQNSQKDGGKLKDPEDALRKDGVPVSTNAAKNLYAMKPYIKYDYTKAEKYGVYLISGIVGAATVISAYTLFSLFGFFPVIGVVVVGSAVLIKWGHSLAEYLTDKVVFRLMYGETLSSHFKRVGEMRIPYSPSQESSAKDGGDELKDPEAIKSAPGSVRSLLNKSLLVVTGGVTGGVIVGAALWAFANFWWSAVVVYVSLNLFVGIMMHFNTGDGDSDQASHSMVDFAAAGLNVLAGWIAAVGLTVLSAPGLPAGGILFLFFYLPGVAAFVVGHNAPWEKISDPRQNQKDGGSNLLDRVFDPGRVKKNIEILNSFKVVRSESEQAAEMLGKLGDQSAVEPLTRYLVRAVLGDHYDAAPAAERALRQLGKSDSDIERIYLDAFLNTNNHPLVRIQALEILGKYSGSAMSLKELSARGEEKEGTFAEHINRVMNEAVAKISQRAQREKLFEDGKTTETKKDGGDFEPTEEEQMLVKFAEDLGNPVASVRAEAYMGLLKMKKLSDELKIVRAVADLDDQDSDVRFIGAVALGEIGDLQTIEPLIAALNDESKNVRMAAIFALGKIGNPNAVRSLLKLLDDPDSYTRLAAAEAIGNMVDTLAIAHLESLRPQIDVLMKDLDSANSEVRLTAVLALGKKGNPKALERLIKILDEDPVMAVRRAAVLALGEIGDLRAIAPLHRALANFDVKDRFPVALALQSIVRKPGNEAKKDGGTVAGVGARWLEAWFNLQLIILRRPKLSDGEWKVALGTAQEKAGAVAKEISQSRQFREQQAVKKEEIQRERVYISASKVDDYGNPRIFTGEEIIAEYSNPLSPDFDAIEKAVNGLSLRDVVAVLREIGEIEKQPGNYNETGVEFRDGGIAASASDFKDLVDNKGGLLDKLVEQKFGGRKPALLDYMLKQMLAKFEAAGEINVALITAGPTEKEYALRAKDFLDDYRKSLKDGGMAKVEDFEKLLSSPELMRQFVSERLPNLVSNYGPDGMLDRSLKRSLREFKRVGIVDLNLVVNHTDNHLARLAKEFIEEKMIKDGGMTIEAAAGYLGSEDPAVRQAARQALIKIKGVPAAKVLFDAVNSARNNSGRDLAELVSALSLVMRDIEDAQLMKDTLDMLNQIYRTAEFDKDFYLANTVRGEVKLLERSQFSLKDGGKTQPPEETGGVDFRAVPIATGAVPVVLPGANAIMPKVSLTELDNQWKEIQRAAQNAELPYEKMKQFVSCCKAQEKAADLKEEVVAYVVNLLKLEEERAIATPEALKEIVALVAA